MQNSEMLKHEWTSCMNYDYVTSVCDIIPQNRSLGIKCNITGNTEAFDCDQHLIWNVQWSK
jgi:hypothetical protein